MDLGVDGSSAIICASSRSLGRASAEARAREGVDVLVAGRGKEDVEIAVPAPAALGHGGVKGLACDVTTREGREAMVAAFPDADILVNNRARPPPKAFLDIDGAELFTTHYQVMDLENEPIRWDPDDPAVAYPRWYEQATPMAGAPVASASPRPDPMERFLAESPEGRASPRSM